MATTNPDGTPMIARAYFELFDAIAAARTLEAVGELRARLTAIEMHPLERAALERQIRHRELALRIRLER